MNEQNEQTKSEFDMSFSMIKRISTYLWRAGHARESKNLLVWLESLISVSNDLRQFMKPQEIEETDKTIKILMEQILYVVHQIHKKGIPSKIYWDLYNYECFLRDILNKSGLGYKIKERGRGLGG